jgi:hypothetical protein
MSSRLAAVTAVLLALAAPPAARAEPAASLRIGIAPAVGSVVPDVPVSDAVQLQFPIQLDAGWAFGPLTVGAYGSWGYGLVGNCDGSCDASVVRAGLEATWTFSSVPDLRGAAPWGGVGAGYEWATERRSGGGSAVTTTWRGFELFAVQGGLEWRVAPAVALGPFLLVGLGRYTDIALDTGGDTASAELTRRAVHAWIHAGVRGRLVFDALR